jgi:hypothetical protein
VRGEGQFRLLESSQPYFGEVNQLEKVFEFKVEIVCTDSAVKEVVKTLFNTHPMRSQPMRFTEF